jgi:hypothetical protein
VFVPDVSLSKDFFRRGGSSAEQFRLGLASIQRPTDEEIGDGLVFKFFFFIVAEEKRK